MLQFLGRKITHFRPDNLFNTSAAMRLIYGVLLLCPLWLSIIWACLLP